MKQLSGLDASFLYAETPSLHLHTLKVAVMETTDATADAAYARFRREFEAHLHLLPPFRRRAVRVPFDLDHPRWVEDTDFRLDRHLRRVTVEGEDPERALAAVVSDVAGRQLDRRHPLWEITVVDGIGAGKLGFVAKIHHAVADGVAANELLLAVLAAEPNRKTPEPRTWTPDGGPSRASMFADGVRSVGRRARTVPALLERTARGIDAVVRRAIELPGAGAVPFRTPVLRFNAALTARRDYATVDLPFDRLRAIQKREGTTLNDVFLAVVAGALRTWLEDLGELPARPLVAGVPSSIRESDVVRLWGNRVSNLFAPLHVELADPVERLRATHRGMLEAKERHARFGPDLLERWAELAPAAPYSAAMRAWSRLRLSNVMRPPINVIVSNVPGPRSPLWFGDAKLASFHSIGPILEGIGLNLTAWSYVDKLAVAILACPDHGTDPWRIAESVERAFLELERATLR